MDQAIVQKLKAKADVSREHTRELLTELAALPGGTTETDEPDGYGRRRCISHDIATQVKNTMFLDQWVELAESL